MAATWQGPKVNWLPPWSPRHHLHYISPTLQQVAGSMSTVFSPTPQPLQQLKLELEALENCREHRLRKKRQQSLSSTSAPILPASSMSNLPFQDNDSESSFFPSVKNQIRAKLHESIRQSIDNCSIKSDPF